MHSGKNITNVTEQNKQIEVTGDDIPLIKFEGREKHTAWKVGSTYQSSPFPTDIV